MDTRARALALLVSGVTQQQCAAALGVTESRIAQFVMEPEFAAELLEKRIQEHTRLKDIDNKWDELEEKLLERFEQLLPLFVKPRDILDALTRVNAAKRKLGISGGTVDGDKSKDVVNITLPAITIHNYKININGQMTEVAGRKLQSVSSQLLLKNLDERRSRGKEPALLEGTSRKAQSEREISPDSV